MRASLRVMRPAADLSVKHLVIGGGVVGLATAARLSREGSTILLEKNTVLGEEVSARNSEVLHAGLYYPEDSLKTKLCILGKLMLTEACKQYSLPWKNTGKWVVAQNDEESKFLADLEVKAKRLGVPLHFISEATRLAEEPKVRCKEALVSPSTGILDSHAIMQFFEGRITANEDSNIVTHTKAVSIAKSDSGYLVDTVDREGERCLIEADSVVNCAGLYADLVAQMALGDAFPAHYRQYYCKGNYYAYSRKTLVSRLIYPVPEKNLKGLGVHVTIDLAGHMRFGPDAFYIDRPTDPWAAPDYTVYEYHLDDAHKAITKYLPEVKRDALYADYSGIRPKLAGPGEPFRDFLIEEESARGFPGLVNLLGIESPGLTSSPAIAEHVAEKLGYNPCYRPDALTSH
ncbi:L-2-hydroxyglutarate dehydrogenase, mitochondrial precursor, putative [Acanthamoeba castellanii str. Neff]|uniref:L-2-hydroxyglutarate dehydrogenase, mitochondrial n=1 Tax=Acanthamoeba castellanii (strain ATCC 30010 / Neff) TaxID=1257118 RepID=L8H9J5_ACACF|nr:L-2-hydroxyglutarate dehydrogenase, mitochondrial precursor, putative [Acanthamoeba castellanii str. Neff]ELR21408.1 L-2-hydroxyglutarate dehydrogenase, mitochondrial precursor, putative [Acanthamoeba castellanii str. Neff]